MAYEIEIKCLLGDIERANSLRERMVAVDPESRLISKGSQLNHYFKRGDIRTLADVVSQHLDEDKKIELYELAGRGYECSVRTRAAEESVILVVKASIDDTTSANGIARREFEAMVGLPLEELDKLLLAAGYSYQAKWSRDREEYLCRNATICLDRNAGYGYIAEIEKVVDDEMHADSAQAELRTLLEELELEELPQDRLERMFEYYNKHWFKYYGTTNTFIVE